MTLKRIFVLFLFACSLSAAAQNPVFNVDVDKPTKDGTDGVEITTTPAGNNNQSLGKVDVDIKKDDTAAEKAKKVADAINSDPDTKDKVTAVSIGDQVSVVGKDGNKIKRIRYRSKTGQGRNKVTKGTDGDVPNEPPADEEEPKSTTSEDGQKIILPFFLPFGFGVIQFTGEISGMGAEGMEMGTVTVGTYAGEVTFNTMDFPSVMELNVAIVDHLNAMGIDAYLDPAMAIVIILGPADGNAVFFGTDDMTLDVWAEIGN